MPLASGTRLGPYEILGLIGAGGMGEVYRALDARLGREVAVKVLPEGVGGDGDRLQRFEREARAVAALNHPNILTVYDVGTHEGVPYVVTELLEGETLQELARRRAPTQRQVLGYSVQVAQGLDAAHQKGIVHRDLKPANLFVMTGGRVKVLDFGLAKLIEGDALDTEGATVSRPTEPGRVFGTVAYMSPEQARARPVDHRSDIFSFGVVLYELLSGKHPFLKETAVGTLTAIVEEMPADLSTVVRGIPPAVGGIVRRCLEKDREQRFRSAHDLALSLEAVLAAPPGSAALEEVEERSPYPGLMSFTERDAASFFGREQEVAALWGRLRARKLLAVIAPSGAGKTSLVRAGVVASRPEGWATIVATPGAAPLRGLGRALVPELSGDAEALRKLVDIDDPAVAFDVVSRWRRSHGEALVVVDQFEELFTLTPDVAQAPLAALLGRLAHEADVHVLLSLRDDFLIRCSEHGPLAPVFLDLTPLPALSPEGLRRALVEPAGKRGYRFEDDSLVEEMVGSVEGVRGALPLLAFAMSRLWEKRDRQKRVLTRAAYEEIGGVAGALAQHAEATLDRIGTERQGMVREIFRNLVTSHGTRAVAEREELLSLFAEREAAEEVLRELIDARLLTSYEVTTAGAAAEGAAGAEAQPAKDHHRVEIVHESLLKAWPRLVRWQTQDEEGALLRDQLKQAARLWDEKGRSADLLWSGTSFREYELWRERYQGALTALEEDFAQAMAERARRRKRLVRATVAAAFIVLAGFATAIGVSRHQATRARDQAKAEALRAEAGKLLALGRTYLEADPTAALAYAKGSLDLFDTREARTFALEVLWRGPVAQILPLDQAVRQLQLPDDQAGTRAITISPDGRWLATTTADQARVLLFPSDAGTPRALPVPSDPDAAVLAFGPHSDSLITGASGHALKFWSVPDMREIRTVPLGAGLSPRWWGEVHGEKLFVVTQRAGRPDSVSWLLALPDGDPRVVAVHPPGEAVSPGDSRWAHVAVSHGQTIGLRSLDGTNRVQILGRTREMPWGMESSPRGDLVATTDVSGETRIWSTRQGAKNPVRILEGPEYIGSAYTQFDPQGRRVSQLGPNESNYIWDLEEVPDAQPLVVGRPGQAILRSVTWDPAGRWLVTGAGSRTTIEFWPVSNPRRRALSAFASSHALSFTPDGRWLATCVVNKPVRFWPLSAREGSARNLVPPEPCVSMAMHPTDGRVLVGTASSKLLLYPASGEPARVLADWFGSFPIPAFDPQGRQAVAVPFDLQPIREPERRVVRVWDLASGRERSYSVAPVTDAGWSGFATPAFAADGLYVGGRGGVRRLTFPAESGGTVTIKTIHDAPVAITQPSPDRSHLLVLAGRSALGIGTVFEEMLFLDLARGGSRRITTHGARLSSSVLSPTGRVVVTGGHDGAVRAGPVTGEEPHVLFGHKGPVTAVAISPDERWIASASDDAISIWPMPDVTKPPLHTLPHDELMAKLDAVTNLRVVRDPTSSTGWKLDVGPFPGWKDVPTW